MAEKLRELRLLKKLKGTDMIAVVKGIYPKYDKVLQSKCEKGDEYGIQLQQKAMTALLDKFAPELRKDGHRLHGRISCRLEDEEYQQLQQFIREDGFGTMQNWLSFTVRKYIRKKQKEAIKCQKPLSE